jgi:hypothetical protein
MRKIKPWIPLPPMVETIHISKPQYAVWRHEDDVLVIRHPKRVILRTKLEQDTFALFDTIEEAKAYAGGIWD